MTFSWNFLRLNPVCSLAIFVGACAFAGTVLGQQSAPHPVQMNRLPPVPQAQTPPNPARPPQQAVAPKLSITPAQPPAIVAPVCKYNAPLVSVNVVVRNTGAVPYASPQNPFPIIARDDAKIAWMGRAPLPSLPAGASKLISIPLYPPSYFPRADGPHRFTVYAPFGKTGPIAVTLPAGVCGELARRIRASVTVLAGPAPMQATPMGLPHNPPTVPQQLTPQDIELARRMAKLAGSPTGLTSTVDPKICGDHGGLGGGLACSSLLPQGRMALVWVWTGPNVEGFNVYRVDGRQHARIGRQANGRDATMYIVDPIPQDGGYAGKCYAVSAYRGREESPLSLPFCANGGNIVQTATFTPASARSEGRNSYSSTGLQGTVGGSRSPAEFDSDPWGLVVGYTESTHKAPLGDDSFQAFHRMALFFDTTSTISHRHIYAARLKLTVDTSYVGEGNAMTLDHHTSCAAIIGVGQEQWWNWGNWVEPADVLRPGVYQGPDIALDVTSIVSQWAAFPDQNYGLVLKGEREELFGFVDRQCFTIYDPTRIQLEVQYY